MKEQNRLLQGGDTYLPFGLGHAGTGETFISALARPPTIGGRNLGGPQRHQVAALEWVARTGVLASFPRSRPYIGQRWRAMCRR